MKIIGIDPGLSGAIAIITDDGQQVFDMPVMEIKAGKKKRRELNLNLLATITANCCGADMVVIEKVGSMPKQGVASSFKFGKTYGTILGMIAMMGTPYELIHPRTWKKAMMSGMGKEKDAARYRAQQLFPTAELHLKKHDGRAEALLLAEYGRRYIVGDFERHKKEVAG